MATYTVAYGVCPSCPANIETGAGTMSISSGIATFTVAQTHALFGQGAEISYNDGTAKKCYVAYNGKTSTTVWRVTDAVGRAPANCTGASITAITHPYASLSAAEAGASDVNHLNKTNLAEIDVELHFENYCEQSTYTADTTNVSFIGYTGNDGHIIVIETPTNTTTQCNLTMFPTTAKYDTTKARIESDYVSVTYGVLYTDDTCPSIIRNVQVHSTYTGASSTFAIHTFPISGGINYVDGCIVMVRSGGNHYAVRGGAPAATLYVSNNLMICKDTTNSAGYGLCNSTGSISTYGYSNTICFFSYPVHLDAGAGTTRQYNNVYIGNTNASSTTDSDFNVYDISDGDLNGFLTTQTDAQLFTDVSGATHDLWDFTPLDVTSDIVAKGSFLLSTFNGDMFHPPKSGFRSTAYWDCGCVQILDYNIPRLGHVAYGVCPSCPANFETGAGTMSISSGFATFTVAQTHALMGVGAEISYNDGTAKKCYVAPNCKRSTTVWGVTDALGAPPADCTGASITAITHPYASLSAADAGSSDVNHLNSHSLTALGVVLHWPNYCEQSTYTADTTNLALDGWTSGVVYNSATYIKIYNPRDTATECNLTMFPTTAKYSTTKARMENAGTAAGGVFYKLGVSVFKIEVNNLQIYATHNGATQTACMSVTSDGNNNVSGCIFMVKSGGVHYGVVEGGGGTSLGVSNCLIICADTTNSGGQGVRANLQLGAYENIICGFTYPAYKNAGSMTLKNNIYFDNTNASSGATSKNYDVYDINESETYGTLTSQTASELFTDASGATPDLWDYTPKTGSDALFRGLPIDPSPFLTHPYDGDLLHPKGSEQRATTWWDCGCVQITLTDPAIHNVAYGSCPSCPADFKTGAGTMSITSGVATFTVAQTHVLMGVGAEISYNDGTAKKCYVAPFGKNSTSSWHVTDRLGNAPANCVAASITAITHPYASLSAAEAGCTDANHLGNGDLTWGPVWANIHFPNYCEQSTYTADTTTAVFSGITGSEDKAVYVYNPRDTTTECNLTMFPTTAKYSVTKARIESSSTLYVLAKDGNYNCHPRFHHLQLYSTYTGASTPYGMYPGTLADEVIYIYSCIVMVKSGGNHYGIVHTGNSAYCYIWNCLILCADTTNSTGHGIRLISGTSYTYAYSNTITGFACPLVRTTGTFIASNNVFFGNTAVCNGTITQNYDVYDIDEGETSGCLTVQPASDTFADASGVTPDLWDYTPLNNVDNDILCRGIPLGLPYDGDMFHDAESAYRSTIWWDTGCVQITAVDPSYETRSVAFGICPSCPADFKTGAGTMSITSGVATFTVAQTDVLMGEGAEISYNDGTAKKCYVAPNGKTSTTVWRVTTKRGNNPVNCVAASITAITHPYASLSAAEAGASDADHIGHLNLKEIGGANANLCFACYCEQSTYTADTTIVAYGSWIGDATHVIYVYSPISTKTQCNLTMFATKPQYNTTKYRLESATTTYPIYKTSSTAFYMYFHHLQVYCTLTTASTPQVFYIGTQASETCYINSCILMVRSGGNHHGIGNAGSGTIEVVNNLIICVDVTNSTGGGLRHVGGTFRVYSNTIYGFATPANITSGYRYNNLFIGNTGPNTSTPTAEDYEVYDKDESEVNGFLTAQTDAELFTDVSGATHDLWDFTPLPETSDALWRGNPLGSAYDGDMFHPAGLGYRSPSKWDDGCVQVLQYDPPYIPKPQAIIQDPCII